MTVGLMGKKVGMTQIFDEEGLVVPVTIVKMGENIVTRKLSKEKNGYEAVQIGGFKVKESKLNKPEQGQLTKSELPLVKPLKEFRVDDTSPYNLGDAVALDSLYKEGMLVDVRGRSIGKGFQGTIKRYGAGRGPMSHGSKFHRSMGSIGAGTTPGRVYRGAPMPGQMGNKNVCTRKLTVVKVDTENGLLLVKGAVPGAKGGLVVVTPSRTKWN
ncbi:50S ribosomal protein L3 [bacterium]|nr:50S ribosomal protein L3 [bacterium]